MPTAALHESDFTQLFSQPSADPAGNEERGGEFYRRVLESLWESVLITDAHWRIVYANGLIEKTTGYTPEVLLGLSPLEVFVPREALGPSVCENKDPVAETDEHVELEIK